MVLTGYFVLSPVIGLFCHRRLSGNFRKNLTPASRRQDHTTSPSASVPFVFGTSASTASRPASVTIARAPLCGTGWGRYKSDLGQVSSKSSVIQKFSAVCCGPATGPPKSSSKGIGAKLREMSPTVTGAIASVSLWGAGIRTGY